MHAHCYLHRPSLVPFGHRIPVAPHYLLKLKACDAIRMVRPPWSSSGFGACHAGMLAVREGPALALPVTAPEREYLW